MWYKFLSWKFGIGIGIHETIYKVSVHQLCFHQNVHCIFSRWNEDAIDCATSIPKN